MRKKIALVTLLGWFNNGNRLQNYALQYFLEHNFDVDVKTIFYKNYLTNITKKDRQPYDSLIYKPKDLKRHRVFKKFDDIVNYDTKFYTKRNIKELNDSYDYFICGSDQIWNTWYDSQALDIYFLANIDKNKKISYAASVGRETLNEVTENQFKRYLDTFHRISVREKQSIEILSSLTNKKIEAHIDPTFLVPKDIWQMLSKKPKHLTTKDYIFVCMLGGFTPERTAYIENMSKEYNLDIVNISDKSGKYYTCGPNEFLYLIKNAKLVLTDSFHAIVFSIIFHTPFAHMKRLADGTQDMSVRLTNLERMFGTKFNSVSNCDKDSFFEFNIDNVEDVIEYEKQRAIDYLRTAFSNEKIANNLNDKDFDCTGCGLCASICPTNAISYRENENGFIRPSINEEKCIHCGLCSSKCIQLQNYTKLNFERGIFAYKSKKSHETNSSTIGLVNIIAQNFIREGGVVFGVPYNQVDNSFVRVDTVEGLEKLKGSKYYQADITKIYQDVQILISQNIKVMICATPCQITGLYHKFGNNPNLFLVQLICHGVPPFRLFKQLCLETYGELPKSVNFKLHHPSWDNYSVEYKFDDKEEKILANDDSWMKLFLSNLALNDCCYTCKYAGSFSGADLIVGDCWGIKKIKKSFYNKDGVSIVVPCSEKAIEILASIRNNFKILEIPKLKYRYCNSNLFESLSILDKKTYQMEFYRKIGNENGVVKTLDSLKNVDNTHITFMRKIKNLIKKILWKVLWFN